MPPELYPEVWKSVPGYEGCYEVSDRGSVRSLDRSFTMKNGVARHVRGRTLSLIPLSIQYKTRQVTYRTVRLYKPGSGKSKARLVHHLVLEAFVGPRPKDMECRHFPDPDPSNNRLTNLCWATHRENEADKRAHGTAFGTCPGNRTHGANRRGGRKKAV